MNRQAFCLAWLILAAALPGAAAAASVPSMGQAPASVEAYRDADPAAAAMLPRPGRKASLRRELNLRLQRNPRDVSALSQRAFFFYVSGDVDEGARDFERALAASEPGTPAHRRALWSWGWALLENGDDAQALAKWRMASEQAAPLRPFWVPYTFAVAHWRLGDRDTALAWYDVAVESNPEWGTAEGRDRRTGHWREPERKAIVALFEAWKAANAAR